ncbi:MAG: succinate dehydrogenase [Candidatus Melainabacteria bacterium]|nr:succinate dehydrogenase [Candidatus Melainabacteria bacterium]
MNDTKTASRTAGLGSTARHDAWWIEPATVAIGFGIFIVYATWRVLEGAYYEWGPYLSPFYSPKLAFDWWQWSPAILVLWVPALFRATCYYYRKAYYRAYFWDPPGCAVGHLGGERYSGESKFPLIFQNLHRYFLYLAIIVLGFLWYDAIVSFNFEGSFGIGLGSLVLLGNVLFLSNYTFGCHAFRHLIGGRLNCFSCSQATKTQLKAWQVVSKLNEHHMLWAWVSLFSVGFADFYVRMLATGTFTDIRLF